MDEGSEWIATITSGSKKKWIGPCKAHNVSISPEEDRRRTKGAVGEVQSREEKIGRVPAWRACCENAAGFRALRSMVTRRNKGSLCPLRGLGAKNFQPCKNHWHRSPLTRTFAPLCSRRGVSYSLRQPSCTSPPSPVAYP